MPVLPGLLKPRADRPLLGFNAGCLCVLVGASQPRWRRLFVFMS